MAVRPPGQDENPLGAWYVRTEIAGPPDGPLAGRRVAIKDNIEVAGVPMMNGSRTLEGFVPSRDATVVTRLLAAGAMITGKSVCEDLCFDDATCLRVAHAFEGLSGGFPAPPAAA